MRLERIFCYVLGIKPGVIMVGKLRKNRSKRIKIGRYKTVF